MKKGKPVYLLAGGQWKNPAAMVPLLREILLQTGSQHPRVASIGAANGDDRSFFELTRSLLNQAGAKDVDPVFLAGRRADVRKARSVLRAADAVFVSGGDVEEGMRWLQQHRLRPFLHERRREGILFFGISAGSIMLGTQWVRWENSKDDSTAELFDCLGIAPLLCDMHAEDDGWEELKTAVSLLGREGQGYGIPSGGAIRVEGDGALVALAKPVVRYANRSGRAVRLPDLPAPHLK